MHGASSTQHNNAGKYVPPPNMIASHSVKAASTMSTSGNGKAKIMANHNI